MKAIKKILITIITILLILFIAPLVVSVMP